MPKTLPPGQSPYSSLNYTLAVAFITLSVLILLISGSLLVFANLQTQDSLISSNQQLSAKDAAKTVSDFFQEKISVLRAAIWINDLSTLSNAQREEVIGSLIGLDPAFRQIMLLNTQGNVLAQVSRLSMSASGQFNEQVAQQVLPQYKGQNFISRVYIDALTGEPLVIVAVPVFNVMKQNQGMLAAEINLKFIWNLVDQLKVGETGFAYVVDRQGNLLAFTDTARVLQGENVENLKVVSDFIHAPAGSRKARVSVYTGIKHSLVAGIYEPLAMPDWAVIIELPWQEAYRPMIREVLLSIGILLAMILLVSGLGVYQARRLALPLIHLTETATHIAAGDRDLQAVVDGPKEVAALATAFNSMTAQLRQSLESLEQKVADLGRAESSLRKANETLQALFDYAPLSLIMLDTEGGILMWNRAAEKTFGWTAEEVIGKPLPTVPEGQDKEFHQIRQRVIQGESIRNAVVERRRKDGSIFLLDLSVAPIRDHESKIYAQISIGTDITERRRTEQSLMRTQFTMDHTREAILWIGKEGYLNYANKAACELLEYTRDEINSVRIFDIDPMFSPEMWPIHWEISNQHSGAKIESVLRSKTGRMIPIEVTSDYMNFAGEEYHSAIIQDITERKLAEKALKESELKFRTVVENAQAIIFILDKQGKFVLSEGKALIKLGLRPGEVVGGSALEIYKDYPSITEAIVNALKGSPVRVINEIGTVIFDTVYSPFLDSAGQMSGVVGVAIDITEQKKAEQALRLASFALERVADAVYWMDREGQLVEVNEAACRMLGYSKDEFLHMKLMDMDPNITTESWQASWERLSRNNTFTVERQHRAKNGRLIPVEVVANFIEFGGQQLDCALVRDITLRKEAEEGIRRLNTELEQRVRERTLQLEAANKELEAFAYSVSHDLRAPLRAVDGYTRILVEDYEASLDDNGKRVCAIIRDETRRMGQLIDDLLAFSRLNRAEMQSAQINMEKLVQSVFLDLTTPENRERIIFQASPLLPATGDPSMIRQVWINLLSNAIKFSRNRDQAVICVESTPGTDEVIYSVRDNGAGFDMRYSDKLFGVFQRLHSEREFEGTGVGLAIMQRVIHRHGGRVWAEGKVNQGATFFFTLPQKGGNE